MARDEVRAPEVAKRGDCIILTAGQILLREGTPLSEKIPYAAVRRQSPGHGQPEGRHSHENG